MGSSTLTKNTLISQYNMRGRLNNINNGFLDPAPSLKHIVKSIKNLNMRGRMNTAGLGDSLSL